MRQVAGAPLGQVRRQGGDAARIEHRRIRPQGPGRGRSAVGGARRIAHPPEGPDGSAADLVRRFSQEATGRQPSGAAQPGDQTVNGHRDP